MKQNKNLNSASAVKRIKTILMVALLCMGTLGAWAQSGDFGTLHWELVDGTLTISGTGDIPNYTYYSNVVNTNTPWFDYRFQITQAKIIDGVTSIGDATFCGCSNLTSIIIPNSVTNIGSNAFYFCSGLTSVTIPNSVTSIGNNAFSNCTGLTSVAIPNNVTSIGYGIFEYCSGLTSVAIPNSVISIRAGTFNDCSSLTSITIPNSVTSIENGAFYGCSSLTSITIPNSVTNIENFAFWGCSGLTSVAISNSMTSIGNRVFCECRNLTFVTIPNSVTNIEYGAFLSCSSLTSISIPNSVTSIGDFAFFDCSSLTSVTNLNTTPQNINSNVFGNVNLSATTLYVPLGSKSAYASAPVWKDFGKIVEIGAITPYYTAVTQPYSSNMTFTASILLNGTELQSDQLEIGAFCGNECRGSVLLQNYPEATTHPYLGFLVVHGNDNEINNITFKVYNHETGKEYIATNAPISFVADDIYGSLAAPYSIMITEAITQTIPLVEGWSWISVNVVNDNPSLMNQFKENIGAVGVLLKGQNEYIQTPGWIGTLSAINNTAMYMVNTTAAGNLPFTGLPVDPAATPITLLNGWNWIGYTPQVSLPINNALANLNPQDGDQIKSRTDYAQYTNGQGWVGGLATMTSGEGYKYYSANTATQTLVYPSTASSQLRSSSNGNTLDLKWIANANLFANNMTFTFVVSQDNSELQSDNIEIGAFCGNECRGSVRLQNVPQIAGHPYMGFLVVYGENNDAIRLRVYNHETGQEYEADNVSLPFVSDTILGNPSEPYLITASPTGISKVQTGSVSVYMDASGEKLIIRRPWSIIDRLEIVDLNGRIVWKGSGFAAEFVDVAYLVKGMYVLKLVKDNQSFGYKFVKK